jgi:hypothetical protein
MPTRANAFVNNEEIPGKIPAKMFHVKHLRPLFAVKRCTKISLERPSHERAG